MDNLTHTLTGIALARIGLDKRVPGATLTLALASNLPDLDLVTAFAGSLAYLDHHRGLSHAFSASPVLAGALAFVLSRRRFGRPFVPTFLVAWLGVILHIVWDLWTSYGTRALLPFDPTWYSWDWMFIIDPAFLILLGVASFGLPRLTSRRVKAGAFALAIAYIGLRAEAHRRALDQAKALTGGQFSLVRALPAPLSLQRWRLLARSDESFATGYVAPVGESRSLIIFPRTRPGALEERVARESRAARVFLDFSPFPRLETSRNAYGSTIKWRDLRFTDRRADGFFCEVTVDRSGQVISERIVF